MYAHKGSLNVATQECGFKLITRWYRTPTLLHKFSPCISDRCWRCKQEEGSMLHIWWSCPLLQNFWKMVHGTITSLTSENISFNPAQYLLHYNSIPKKTIFKIFTHVHDKCSKTLYPMPLALKLFSIEKRMVRRINNIENIEELEIESISQEKISKFTSTWYNWFEFKNSQSYKAIIN